MNSIQFHTISILVFSLNLCETMHVKQVQHYRRTLHRVTMTGTHQRRRSPQRPSSRSSSFSERYPLDNYSTSSLSRNGGVHLIRQDSYISAVRSAHPNEPSDFGEIRTAERERERDL